MCSSYNFSAAISASDLVFSWIVPVDWLDTWEAGRGSIEQGLVSEVEGFSVLVKTGRGMMIGSLLEMSANKSQNYEQCKPASYDCYANLYAMRLGIESSYSS